MDLYIDRDDLVRGLERATAACHKSTNDLHETVHLAAREHGIDLTARGADASVVSEVVCNTCDAGTARVHGRHLLGVVRALPHPTVQLSRTPKALRLRSGRATVEVDLLDAEEAQPFTVVDPVAVEVDAAELRRMLAATAYAMATDDVRYGLNGLHLELVEHGGAEWLRAVATDGHRLPLAGTPIRSGQLAIPPKMLVPRAGVAAMRTVLRDAERHDRVALSFTPSEVDLSRASYGSLTSPWGRVGFALVHGEFPDYHAVFPERWTTRIEVRRRDLLDVLKRAAVVLPSDHGARSARTLALTTTGDGLIARTRWSGRFEEHLPAEVDGVPLTLGFGRGYLLQAAEGLTGDRMVLETAGALSPVRIVDPDGNGHDLQIIMPHRLDEDDLRNPGVTP